MLPEIRLGNLPLYYHYEKTQDRYPSLRVIPDQGEYEGYLDQWVPVIMFGKGDGIRCRQSLSAYLTIPVGRLELKKAILTHFNPHVLYLPQGWIKSDDRGLTTNRGRIALTRHEASLLAGFIGSGTFFLSLSEIHNILDVKYEIPLISRLRAKLKRNRDALPGVDLFIHRVKQKGYYLNIVVDNLWKSH